MTAYATYDYYVETYLGTSISSTDFSRLILRASAAIDRLTFGRVPAIILENTDAELIDKIKMATCAVAEEIQTNEKSDNTDGIASERVGNYSVSYRENSKAALTTYTKIKKAAKFYLGDTGLMYPGLLEDE